ALDTWQKILLLLGVWLWLTPSGFFGKLKAIGYSVCHQIPGRSFHLHNHSFPLCARCTGMYLGALLALGFQFLQGRKGKFPPIGTFLLLAVLFLGFALDGINSFLHLLPGQTGWYEPQNWLRLVTGMGAGLCIGAVLAPIFNQTVWADWQDHSALDTWQKILLLLGVAGLVVLGILGGFAWIRYPAAILSGLGVLIVLSLVYTILAVLILKRSNLYRHERELLLPGLMGLFMALLQIAGIDLIRYFLTGAWSAINLR
ncbi:MAG: DUF2085 domain-containing protein, partial [Anaerolineaceae bacterium]